jgi:hypothetical protein
LFFWSRNDFEGVFCVCVCVSDVRCVCILCEVYVWGRMYVRLGWYGVICVCILRMFGIFDFVVCGWCCLLLFCVFVTYSWWIFYYLYVCFWYGVVCVGLRVSVWDFWFCCVWLVFFIVILYFYNLFMVNFLLFVCFLCMVIYIFHFLYYFNVFFFFVSNFFFFFFFFFYLCLCFLMLLFL